MNKSEGNNKINLNVTNSNDKKKKKKKKKKNGKAENINNNVNNIKNINLTKTKTKSKKKKKKKNISNTALPNIVVIDDESKKDETKTNNYSEQITTKEIIIIDDKINTEDTPTLIDSQLEENIEYVDLNNEKDNSFEENINNIEVINDERETVSLEEKSNENQDSKPLDDNIIEESIDNIEVINNEIEIVSLNESNEIKENSSDKVINTKEKRNKIKDNKKILKKIILFVTIIFIFIALLSYIGFWYYKKYIVAPIPSIKDVTLNDNTLIIKFDVPSYNKHKKIYCLFKTDDKKPTKDDKKWVLSKNNECSTTITDGVFYAYLKNEDNVIYDVKKSSTIGKIVNFELNKEQVYIAVKGNYTVKATLESIGNVDKTINWYSEDDSIAKVDQYGKITGVKKGNTVIHAKVMDNDISTKVMVTDLITVRPKKYDYNKKIVPCGKHTKAENDLLDEILKDRINDAGYKTRAGAVEAGRFLPLEFPYKIRYFSENGRGNTNGVDGEGRYYHVGLYLDESRYANITKTMMGPKTWGCSLYSRPSKGNRPNGLDCSGYISWVLLNGGFDVKDVGAGLNHGGLDLTDYGDRVRFTDEILNSGKIKVGDLLSSGGPEGGHIAMIVGEDKDFYYVTESLWTPPNVAVVVIAYPKTAAVKKASKSSYEVVNDRYYWIVLMDKYYKEDGNLTQLWY